MSSSLSTADIADSLGCTARALRKFLRSSASPYEPVGQGARYNIDAEDLVELKEKYESWVSRPGSRSTSTDARTDVKRTPRKPKTKIVERVDPLADDGDLMFRLTHTVGERQRLAGVICSYEWHHPKVTGLDVKCSRPTVKGTKFCETHPQVVYCGDPIEPVDDLCGPGGKLPKPYCEYHNGDISDDELETYLATHPELPSDS